MIEIDGKQYMTEKQWYQKKRKILKRQVDKGIEKSWFSPNGEKTSIFFTEEQTRPFNKRELKKYKKEKKDLRDSRRERLSCKCCGKYFGKDAKRELDYGLCHFCQEEHTAWQWLSEKCMIPKAGETPTRRFSFYWDWEEQDYVSSDKEWNYYNFLQVEKVDEQTFEKLKMLYIEKFGGWERIDLENTTYDGSKWW